MHITVESMTERFYNLKVDKMGHEFNGKTNSALNKIVLHGMYLCSYDLAQIFQKSGANSALMMVDPE